MPIHNNDVAKIFNQVADLLEIKGENQYRIRAYRTAARTVSGLSGNVSQKVHEGENLSKLTGIGKDLAGKIETIVKTGKLPMLENLKKEVPIELTEIMNVEGLGAKKVAVLYKKLDVKSLDDLKKAAAQDKIKELEGFGAKTQKNIAEQVERLGSRVESKRVLLSVAKEEADSYVKYLKKAQKLKDIVVAGSFRRSKETVGDLDILVTVQKGSKIMDHFTGYENVEKVVSKGKTKSTVLLRSGLQVDMRVMPQVSYGAALVYFTGSKDHNIAIRKIANKKKWKINEYGIFKKEDRIAGKTESEVYKKIGLKFIEPQLRENRGEIDAARNGNLPKLITVDDIQGDLHVHSKYTDGKYTIEEMAEAARQRGYSYIGMSDHSKAVRVAGGLDEKGLRKQIEEIDKINDKLKGFRILKSSEVDILEDGSLDLPDSILKELDVTICSVHSHFKLSKSKQTERVLKAMENPYFYIMGHPTGRYIQSRDPIELDMDKVLKKAKETDVVMEVNGNPERLDLMDIHCKAAKEAGVKLCINTDAHRKTDLDFIEFGVGQARRGWLEKDDVINTLGVQDMLGQLRKNR